LILRNIQKKALEQLKIKFPELRDQVLILEIQELLCKVLNCERAKLITESQKDLSQNQIEVFNSYLSRRLKNEPLAYILNSQDFYSLSFYVDKNVLIPRPETEILVERAIKLLKSKPPRGFKEVLDIGTGSGAIILSVANAFRENRLNFTALDISKDACDIASKNAKNLNLEINILQSDLLSAYSLNNSPTLFLSNPPYIADAEELMLDVQNYEPALALRGGEIGLEIVYRILELFADSLKLNENNILLLEIGINQHSDVLSHARKLNIKVLDIYKDSQGINRIMELGA